MSVYWPTVSFHQWMKMPTMWFSLQKQEANKSFVHLTLCASLDPVCPQYTREKEVTEKNPKLLLKHCRKILIYSYIFLKVRSQTEE